MINQPAPPAPDSPSIAAEAAHDVADGARDASHEFAHDATGTGDRWTIKRLLGWTSNFFRDKGFDQPRLDAEVLLAEALGCERIFLYTRFDETPDESILARYRDWVARHAEGEPVAYLVGHREFFSLEFRIDRSVLIPRPETEHVVTEALDFIRERGETLTVADVGTGSGNIAIAIARHAPQVTITATDISASALDVAKQNAALHKVEPRIRFLKSDLLKAVIEPEHFDLILSNPPYIGTSEKWTVAESVVEFEPHGALFSGTDGCEMTERLIATAARRLEPGGRLIFETSPFIAGRCLELLAAMGAFAAPRLIKDLAGLPRVIRADRLD